ncbi:hypothetical protein BGW80DRAFT_1492949 [Lactifluus volemus]|nr:hypothetical protein BGW80DRAFT_1492949 [Lactifluus volemus]
MKATFPSIIDGDLLQLVHLSNGFKVVPGHKQLRVGDICDGCRWRLREDCQGGLVSREGKLVIEVQSRFLFRSCLTNFENIFEIVDELITLSLPLMCLLLPKDQFVWSNRKMLEPVSSSAFSHKLHLKTR